jgi:hypothetical protein
VQVEDAKKKLWFWLEQGAGFCGTEFQWVKRGLGGGYFPAVIDEFFHGMHRLSLCVDMGEPDPIRLQNNMRKAVYRSVERRRVFWVWLDSKGCAAATGDKETGFEAV